VIFLTQPKKKNATANLELAIYNFVFFYPLLPGYLQNISAFLEGYQTLPVHSSGKDNTK
jgi:hypothetical protein